MARSLAAGMVTQVTAEKLAPFRLVELEFDSGTLRYWPGHSDLSWNGFTWTGAGTLLSIESVTETAAIRAVGVNVALSGMPPALISLAQTENYQGRPATIYFGCLDLSTGAVVADPYAEFVGKMDTISDEDDGGSATLTLSIESDLIDLEGAASRRYTPEDQALDFPEESGSPNHRDRMFDQVASLQDLQIILK